MAAAHQAVQAEVIIRPGYPCTINHAGPARFAGDVMAELVGDDAVDRDVPAAMTAEDFGFMLEAVPGCYAFIGNGGPGLGCVNLHSSHYDFNDSILGLGARYWSTLVRRWFERAA